MSFCSCAGRPDVQLTAVMPAHAGIHDGFHSTYGHMDPGSGPGMTFGSFGEVCLSKESSIPPHGAWTTRGSNHT